MANKFGYFVLGGLIGVVAGLLVAPRPGRETRAMVVERANGILGDAQSWRDEAVGKGTGVVGAVGDIAAKGQEFVSGVVSKGQSVVENVQGAATKAAGNVKPVFEERSEDLRDKIDAARRRIAEQVAKNAEETSEQFDDVISADDVSAETIESEDDDN